MWPQYFSFIYLYIFLTGRTLRHNTHPNKNPTKYEPVRQRVTGSRAGLTSYRQLCVYFPWAGANRLDVTAPGKHKQSPRCSEMLLRSSSAATPLLSPLLLLLWRCNKEVLVQEALCCFFFFPCVCQPGKQRRGAEGYLATMHIHAGAPPQQHSTPSPPPIPPSPWGHLRAPQHLLTVIKSRSEMPACLIANYRWLRYRRKNDSYLYKTSGQIIQLCLCLGNGSTSERSGRDSASLTHEPDIVGIQVQ